ncbi:MAG: 50S ribosomal protein L9 [Ardenticatenaceae bacterium]|nr:50S ribosomal protein L9 [Ardenticatenaceae bacterium]
MQVLLKEDVENLGLAGEVHKVAPGFGRNYLIPKNLAIVATPKTLKQADAWRKKAETRREEIKAEYEALAAKISGLKLTFTARAGENGRLYGSITTAQITDKMNETLGTEIDRRKVGEEPLRQLGSHQIVVRLSGDFQPELTVTIESEDGEPAAAAAAKPAEETNE